MGLLGVIGGEELVSYLPEIMKVLLTVLQEPTQPPAKKDTALVTLGQVCANTAYVVEPFIEHPEFYAIFARMLKTDTTNETRREVLRVIGILGAVNPYTLRKVCKSYHSTSVTNTDHRGWPRMTYQKMPCHSKGSLR